MRLRSHKRLRMLVAVDFSFESREAFRVARRFVGDASAVLTVAHVRPSSDIRAAVVEDAGDLLKKSGAAFRKAIAQHYQMRLHDLVGPDGEATLLLRGRPAIALCREARKNHDLLVMGSRGRGRVVSTILGSTVYESLVLSKVPVMVVPSRRSSKRSPARRRGRQEH